ncbi:prepilin-type N-terminal cleavage/methylation domain-containing protein [Variovorax sp. PAMC28562]|uniref:pilus assembly FimT family protein n=1 Tax=Variovorax sp. PAMC28562 TaxID=2762323 RepID=UPI00164D03BD|nr:GspH/FimT family pseudopilin [Variovorax sp. PAMC28562]QNK75417.1 prepilin-type N-terminal cleavage/methylation domain-containing protein [Variovorax sp. PAMC28562]
MPTSAVGNSRCGRYSRNLHSGYGGADGQIGCQRSGLRATGFTLLELIVVIAIIALATAGVGLALRDSGQATLDREAERLAALLESARAQSRSSGTAVRFRPTPNGPEAFVFDGLPPGALPTSWMSTGMHAQPVATDGTAAVALLLGPDPIIAAQQLLLTADGPPARTLRIATDGLRPFSVSAP